MINFTKGYDDIKSKTKRAFRFMRMCDNCKYYYKDEGDEEELCQNPNVLKYDIVIDDNRTYCSYWKYCSDK